MCTRKTLFWILLMLLQTSFALAADKYCQNLSFERGDFVNWQGYTWYNSTIAGVTTTSPEPDFSLHSIMTDTLGYDPLTNYKLKLIPPGFKYSARIGDLVAKTQVASLRYTLTVDSTNAFLLYRFAVVLLDPLRGHEKYEEPRFKVTLLNQSGDTIPDCANYDVYASEASLNTSFNSFTPSGSDFPILWRDWTAVGVNLLPYIGQTISIEFMASDCTHKAHYGYAYVVAECHPLQITTKFCAGDVTATLNAPSGFIDYSWRDSLGTVLSKNQTFVVNNPVQNAKYYCELLSATDCNITLNTKISRFDPNPDFISEMVDCPSNTVRFTNTSSTNSGTLEYKWIFDDGQTSTEKAPVHTFATSGLHQVTLELTNPPSECVTSLTKTVESFSPPLVGITGDSTYCYDTDKVILRGYGAYEYVWSDGSKGDSLIVHPPGGNYWMIGKSSTGCVSEVVSKKVSKEPTWDFSVEGNAYFCKTFSTTLKSVGAVKTIWNDTIFSDSLVVNKPRNIKVAGYNKKGCEIVKNLNVLEIENPEAAFAMQPSVINAKHNKMECSVIQPKSDVIYNWTFYENTSNTSGIGAVVQHLYTGIDNSGKYKITNEATDTYGCTSVATNYVTVEPFFPNVFTPNFDGYNELFLKNYDASIYDRYGLLLYSGSEGWNGTCKGKPAPQDTYFYVVNYVDYNLEPHTVKGSVTLLR